jgi:tetratricopeptide (TPR) repeat protein
MREPPTGPTPPWSILLAGGVIVFAAFVAYHNSLSVPFLFDDAPAITDNRTIRQLWPIGPVLSPPPNVGVGGRPLVNLSLAVNYAAGGTAVRGYHFVNLAIHALAGLALLGVVRRTLRRCSVPALSQSEGPALAAALLWTLHPLQTESVTCVVQRTESLMGLFYLLTLYGFIRGTESASPWRWHLLTVAACLLGMASKEVMVSAPLMVFLYDRTFVAGTFREAWRRRRRLYLGLAGTWLLLGYLVISTGGSRGGAAGFGLGITWWSYALTQCQAIVHYLRLALWPYPLIVDYGTDVVHQASAVAPQALLLLGLLTGTVLALRCRPVMGFTGAWFFAILAPSSSVVPLATQTIAEHRMYLPLAAVVVPGVWGLHTLIGRRWLIVGLALAAGLGWLVAQRNLDYRSEPAIWGDTVVKCPGNARAHTNYGFALFQTGHPVEAMQQYEEALRLKPENPEAHNDLGSAWANTGRLPEAIKEFRAALLNRPDFAEAHNNLANVLAQSGRLAEAMEQSAQALRIRPDFPEAHNDLGNNLLQMNRPAEAVGQYQEALRLKPELVEAHYNLGNALLSLGRIPEAIEQFEETARMKPGNDQVHNNLGIALAQAGRLEEAIEHFQEALRISPDDAWTHNALGTAFLRTGRLQEAKEQFKQALRIRPEYSEASENLARLQALP